MALPVKKSYFSLQSNSLFVGYVKHHQSESLKLWQKFPTLNKAWLNAIDVLPKEPPSLVDQYKRNNPPESKNSIIAKQFCRFSKPAYPIDENTCECSGKCATKRCGCKASKRLCKGQMFKQIDIKLNCKKQSRTIKF